MKHLGQTRGVFKHDHLLQTPDTFVRAPLPGMTRAIAIVHCGPSLGAKFTQYTAEVERGGFFDGSSAQRFVYVLEGEAVIERDETQDQLLAGDFAYLPEKTPHRIYARSETRLLVVEKPYTRLPGLALPEPHFGSESAIVSQPVMDDDALQVRCLLPDIPEFDFAVNTMTYQPGASLSMVEMHVMEHGMLMLEGEGIYRLGESWYPVQAGDFIWMRAFCPQWFAALGKTPTKYIIYKDWNRSPLG